MHHCAWWTFPAGAAKQRRHAEKAVRLVYRGGRQAARVVDPGHRIVRGKLVLSRPARRHVDPDGAGAARSRL